MDVLLLGTAAAEGFPAAYCTCAACDRARRLGGPDVRSRSGALIDDDLKIDHGPDTVVQVQRLGRTLAGVRTIIFTHEHGDHLDAPELEWASRPYTATPAPQPVAVYGNDAVLAEIRRVFPDPRAKNLDLRRLTAFEPVVTPTGDHVLPLPADHAPGALLLRVTRDGRTAFYGHDSGRYPPETLAALAAGPPLDVALFDCTYGGAPTDHTNHMGVDGVVEMARELAGRGVVTPRTRLVATHFSHNGGLTHDALVRAFLPHRIEVAFDGMTVSC